MAIISIIDILDEDLNPLTKDEDLENVTQWYMAFCREQNVPTEDIKLDPLPYECKRAAVFWVCVEVSRRNIGKNITTSASGAQTDWYKEKMKVYRTEFIESLRACTSRIIRGVVSSLDDNSEMVTTYERS